MQLEDALEFINDNAIRIKGTRVGIEIVIDRYNEGWSPERMAHEYPALDLKKIYAVITYYLYNKEKLDAYVKEGDEMVEAAWREQRRNPHPGVKRILDYKAKHGLLE